MLLDRTKMTLLTTENVTDEMALFYARQDLKEPVSIHLTFEQYKDIYKGSKNLIIKYDYENKSGKHNVFTRFINNK